MKRIGLAFAFSLAVSLALPPGAAWADGFPGRSRAVVEAGQANIPIGHRPVTSHRPSAVQHRVFTHGVSQPFVRPSTILGVPVVVADPSTNPPTVIINNIAGDTAAPPGAASPESVPPPVQPKMITVNPGRTHDWCWDKATWSWVPACP